jgi:hypothetical protein
VGAEHAGPGMYESTTTPAGAGSTACSGAGAGRPGGNVLLVRYVPDSKRDSGVVPPSLVPPGYRARELLINEPDTGLCARGTVSARCADTGGRRHAGAELSAPRRPRRESGGQSRGRGRLQCCGGQAADHLHGWLHWELNVRAGGPHRSYHWLHVQGGAGTTASGVLTLARYQSVFSRPDWIH